MFERFNEKTIKAVMMAQAEARRLGQDSVGTEMLVVGVVAEGSDVGCRALQQLSVTLDNARSTLEKFVPKGPGGQSMEIPFTTGAKRVLEDAIECAKDLGSASVNTAHVLRAVLKQEEGNGTKLLAQLLNVQNIEALQEQVLAALSKEESADRLASGPQPLQVSANAAATKRANEIDLTNTLKYGQDLTKAAEEGRLDPLVGREEELRRTIRILGRRSKNNPVLVGEAGVGKTSIAYGLAQLIAEGRVPPTLKDKRVVQLDLALLLAGTRYRGDFEERLRAVVREVSESNRRVILVVDEVHTLVGAGSGGGSEGGGIDAANLLKPALARGELQCIGATTLDEYRKYIEKDPALERRFQPVTVPEPTEAETVRILQGLSPKYEHHHQLRYTPEALAAAVKLSSQYIADRCLPDKAIDVMDEAGSKVRQQIFQEVEDGTAHERWSIGQELEEVRNQKKAAVAAERYDEAQRLKTKEAELTDRLDRLQRGIQDSGGPSRGTQRLAEELRALKAQMREAVTSERFAEAHELQAREREVIDRLAQEGAEPSGAVALADRQVTEEDVAQVVAGWTGIAVEQVSSSESAKLLRLEEELHKTIIGQDEAVQSVSKALRRARAGLRNPARPIAGFMFSGPTGVGKTQLCKTLSTTFFGSEASMIRLDMSEYMEKHTVSKLIGAPPGYVGYSDGGTLTEAIRRRPYSLVLFDEVEKAHPDVFNLLLQLLDDGRLTDSKGRTVSFSNCLVVMTSNLGSRSVQKGTTGGLGLGFTTQDQDDGNYSKIKELVNEEMKTFFRPEFLNRLDDVVVFRPLSKEDVRAIAEVEFKKVLARLESKELDVTLTQRFKDRVVTEGFDPAYGARPLKRAITRLLEDTLAEHLLVEGSHDGKEETPVSGRDAAASTSRRQIEIDATLDGEVVVRSITNSVLEAA